MKKCTIEKGCRYSKAMNQSYPRLCVDCGHPERLSSIDEEKYRLSRTEVVSLDTISRVIQLLRLRNEYVQTSNYQEIPIDEIKRTNENIKQLLNL